MKTRTVRSKGDYVEIIDETKADEKCCAYCKHFGCEEMNKLDFEARLSHFCARYEEDPIAIIFSPRIEETRTIRKPLKP